MRWAPLTGVRGRQGSLHHRTQARLQFLGWIGANPTDAVNSRWPGGTLIALALGAYFGLRAPARQDKLVITLTVGYLLA